ncbi:DNA replication/repair protein RecF [Candidatus Peregrinibacteria bacterium]|nr:DNA replication/repair protein RecF [Candidatus Peregrinibacteria bacterium]
MIMKILRLQLENFRNYSTYEWIFEDDNTLTVLEGPNGRGKTNLIEAVYTLSLGKSFRTSAPDDQIKWGEDYLRVKGEISADNEKMDLEVFYSRTPRRIKNFKKNQVDLKNSEYFGNLLTVLFHPEDLNMLYLSPSLRRKYMNILLSQTNKKYLSAFSSYKKVLKQRNVLLYEIREAKFKGKDSKLLMDDLEVWNKQLISFGSEIMFYRNKLVEFLNDNLEKIYRDISGKDERVEVEYSTKVIKGDGGRQIETIEQNFADELFNRLARDIRQAKTTAGPHRDDILFYIDGKDINRASSRGEFRTLLLAIKFAEIEFIKEKTGYAPILLLDDVFSELDPTRQIHLIKAIKSCQTIISTTDLSNLSNTFTEAQNITLVKIK